MITFGILEQYFSIFLVIFHLKCHRSHLGCDWGWNTALVPKFEGWVRSSRFAFFAFSNWNSNFPHVLYSISEGYHAESSFVNKHIWDTFTFLCNRFKCKRNPILDVENRPKCSIEWVCCWGARPWLLKDWSRRAFIHYFGEFRQVLACYITDIWILKAPIFFCIRFEFWMWKFNFN